MAKHNWETLMREVLARRARLLSRDDSCGTARITVELADGSVWSAFDSPHEEQRVAARWSAEGAARVLAHEEADVAQMHEDIAEYLSQSAWRAS